MENSISFNEIMRMLRRRAGMIMSIIVLVSTFSVLIAYFLPPTYVATAKILIESQQIPDALVRTTVTVSATERLELIHQKLMTRATLLSLIDRLDLYNDRPELSKGELVELMRDSTTFQNIGIENSGRRRNTAEVAAFTISYSDSNPRRAAQITNEFVTIILEQNLKDRSERAAQTHDFFREEVAELEAELLKVETEIAEFKVANEMALPESLEFRRREVLSLQEQVFEFRGRILQLREQQQQLQTSLDTGRYAEALEQSLTPEERDLQALRLELTRARGIYADSHPRVRSLRSRIEAMEANLGTGLGAGADDTVADRINTTRQKLEAQIEAIETEIDFVTEQQAAAEERIRLLEASIARTPEVSMALNQLDRRHADLSEQYQLALRKQSVAAAGEKLEVNRQAERFEVIEQAQVPEAPVSPNRPVIAIGGFAGSIGFALGLALLLGFMNSSIRTIGDMERKLDMRPLMTVPYIPTARERRRARRELYALGLLVLIILPVTLYAIDQYYLPLDLLISEFAERTNLHEVLERIARLLNG